MVKDPSRLSRYEAVMSPTEREVESWGAREMSEMLLVHDDPELSVLSFEKASLDLILKLESMPAVTMERPSPVERQLDASMTLGLTRKTNPDPRMTSVVMKPPSRTLVSTRYMAEMVRTKLNRNIPLPSLLASQNYSPVADRFADTVPKEAGSCSKVLVLGHCFHGVHEKIVAADHEVVCCTGSFHR